LKVFNFSILSSNMSVVIIIILLLVITAVRLRADDTHIALDQAIENAFKNNPELASYLFEIQAAEARLQQASLRPNPEIALEAENISGNLPGAKRSENTVELSQLLELGKKRPLRVKKATAELEVLRLGYESLRLNVIAEVTQAFILLQGAHKQLELTKEGYRIASQLSSSVAERVKAGAISPIEETRARVTLSLAATDVERATREVETAQQELARSMGITAAFPRRAEGELREEVMVPELNLLMERLSRNPDLKKWELEKNGRDAALAEERSLAIPDVTLSGGFRHLEETSENTFVVGVSVPLPVFNRNQGAIREAEASVLKLEQERRATEVSLKTQLAQKYSAVITALREANALREEALTGAESAYNAVSEGYNLGKFSYLDVLDAWKALIESKLRYLDALVALNVARIDVERLIAGPLEPETKI